MRENFGKIESFEKTSTGVRMIFSKDGALNSAEAALVVAAVGWAADTATLKTDPLSNLGNRKRTFWW